MAAETVLLTITNKKNEARFPMKWMLLLLFFLQTVAVSQNVVVVKVESAAIKAGAKEDSRTLRVVEKGTQLEYSGTISGWVILVDGGFIYGANVSTIDAFTLQGGKILDKEPVIKDPSEFTKEELLYMLIESNNDRLELERNKTRFDTITKTVTVIAMVAIVVELAIMINDNRDLISDAGF